MKQIYIYGTGRTAKRYFDRINSQEYHVCGFLDSYKDNGSFCDLPIINIKQMLESADWENEKVEIHVASIYFEIVEFLCRQNINRNRIVLCSFKLYQRYVAQYHSSDIGINFSTVLTSPMESNSAIASAKLGSREYANDYCRYNTLRLLCQEIQKNHVSGNAAELGVFRGEFAHYINDLL